MNYLFFDVECANSFDGVGKICEFGYVFTDENLNIIKQGIHLIRGNACHKKSSFLAKKFASRSD